MFQRYTDRVRFLVADALASPRADKFAPAKLVRDVLGTANDLAGRPFCTPEELARRRARRAAASPTETKRVAHRASAAPGRQSGREPAPVMLYFDGKDHRTKQKMEELLRAREIAYQVLDCADDESTRSWATAAAKMQEFPLLFIAGEPVGGLHELVQLDVNGGLARRVFG